MHRGWAQSQPCWAPWPQEIAQLLLRECEAPTFLDFADGWRKCELQPADCACCCSFSEQRLTQYDVMSDCVAPQMRHPRPAEVAILHGLQPNVRGVEVDPSDFADHASFRFSWMRPRLSLNMLIDLLLFGPKSHCAVGWITSRCMRDSSLWQQLQDAWECLSTPV